MKTFMQSFNVIMFFIALLNIQFISSLELSTMAKKLANVTTTLEKQENLDNDDEFCYYNLKQELIIKNYVAKIKEIVSKFYVANEITDNLVTFELFWKAFKMGNYGQIAEELSGSEDYVRSYWTYFLVDASSEKMNQEEFTKFMGLYYLEGELLVEESHPLLTEFFPNEHLVAKRKGCKVAIAYWTLVTKIWHEMIINFKWSQTNTVITKTEIFTIITNTHAGKCQITAGKDCKFFTNVIQKMLGFFNMSSGNRESLTSAEGKMGYSTLLFQDLSYPECMQKKFEAEKLQKKIEAVGL